MFPPRSSISLALSTAENTFRRAGVSEPSLSAVHLLHHSINTGFNSSGLKCDKPFDLYLPAWQKRVINDSQQIIFDSLCKKRLAHEPVQFILGKWDFHCLNNIILRPPILIPRPETEELVDIVLEYIHASSSDNFYGELKFCDIGTGSGAIGLALLKKLPGASCVGIDISPAAVQLSLENADAQGLLDRYSCHHIDIRDITQHKLYNSHANDFSNLLSNFDFIVSNPPYIPKKNMEKLCPDVRLFEDHVALCGDYSDDSISDTLRNSTFNSQGLDVVRDIILASTLLMNTKKEKTIKMCHSGATIKYPLFLELDCTQPSKIKEWLDSDVLPASVVESRCDNSGKPRFSVLDVSITE